MKVTDQRTTPRGPVSKPLAEIPMGTVFSGKLGASNENDVFVMLNVGPFGPGLGSIKKPFNLTGFQALTNRWTDNPNESVLNYKENINLELVFTTKE